LLAEIFCYQRVTNGNGTLPSLRPIRLPARLFAARRANAVFHFQQNLIGISNASDGKTQIAD
jgi:hypothetical protein